MSAQLPDQRRSGSRRARRGDHGQQGFTLIETMLALVILVIGVQGVMLMANRSSQLQQTTSEYVKAHNACRDFLERFRNGDLTTQFQAYAHASTFKVGDQDVTVTFPQSVLAHVLGSVPTTAKFRDLDGNGQVDLNPTSTDPAGLLPVLITVRHGSFQMQMVSLVTDR